MVTISEQFCQTLKLWTAAVIKSHLALTLEGLDQNACPSLILWVSILLSLKFLYIIYYPPLIIIILFLVLRKHVAPWVQGDLDPFLHLFPDTLCSSFLFSVSTIFPSLFHTLFLRLSCCYLWRSSRISTTVEYFIIRIYNSVFFVPFKDILDVWIFFFCCTCLRQGLCKVCDMESIIFKKV